MVSRIILDNEVSADPLTRLATLATLSPKGAQGGEGDCQELGGTGQDTGLVQNGQRATK